MPRYNSTIRQKMGECEMCTDGKQKPLTKFLCSNHYWMMVRMKSVAKQEQKIDYEDGLPELIDEADNVYSRWLRLSNADHGGFVTCYTCGAVLRWQESQCGHFIKRGNLYLRWDQRNTRIQDKFCNEVKDGNLAVFAKNLEKENRGVVEILIEEGILVYKPTREEVRNIISDYSNRIKSL